MNRTSIEGRVGLFVFLTLLLLAALLLFFSKGLTFLTPTYEVRLKTANVGGIKSKAAVLMAGIPVGSVDRAVLEPSGTNVVLHLRIEMKYPIRTNALFVIEQSGFLGDQFVSVYPRAGGAPILMNGDEVICQEPFNLQEVARSAAGFIKRIDETALRLNNSLKRIDQLVLNEETLTNLSVTVANLRQVSENALGTVDRIDALIQSNAPPVNAGVSNLVAFSMELRQAAGELGDLVSSNREPVAAAVKNIESASGLVKSLLADLHAGKGLAGNLLKNEQAAREFPELLEHLNMVSSNLSITTSNLNARGLWWLLWSPKPARTNHPAAPAGKRGDR
jgi:phospholipid/cholesterol/gamma-HCH transport system substrate-binding protein